MGLREAIRVAVSIGVVICAGVGCKSATAPTPTPDGFAGVWRGTTVQATPVEFSVSAADLLTSFTVKYNFSATCSGTLTYTDLAVGIRRLDPPGPPPFDQPGFAFGKMSDDTATATAVNGHFSPDRRSAAGEFVLVKYEGCGTVLAKWSASRR